MYERHTLHARKYADEVKRPAKSKQVKYELRTTLVAGFHTKESIEELSKDLNGQPMLYLQKFVDSGRCIDQGLQSISEDVAKEYQNILKKTIKEVHLRGY